jgi:hypothetical protein
MLSNYQVQYEVVAKPCHAGDPYQRFSIKEMIIHSSSKEAAMSYFLDKKIQHIEASVRKI